MRLRVGDVMSNKVITIAPDIALKDAAVTMAKHGVSGLPVLATGELIGIITESDFVNRLADAENGSLLSLLFRRRRDDADITVAEAMTPHPFTVTPADSVVTAARLMSTKGIKRLPVVDGGRLVGVVSRADLMGVFARSDEAIATDVVNDGVIGLLAADPDSVEVNVVDGVVRLAGATETVTEKRMLEELARRVAGVVRVESTIDARFDDTRLPPL